MPRKVPSYRPPRPCETSRHQHYDRSARDPELKRFYDSTAWRKLRRLKLNRDPQCARCWETGRLVQATHVHHIVEVRDDPERALDPENLESLCHSCHSRLHATTSDPAPDGTLTGGIGV